MMYVIRRGAIQGRIQDLKLGVAQMILYKYKCMKNTIIIVYIYISNTIYFKYTFYIIFYYKPPYEIL